MAVATTSEELAITYQKKSDIEHILDAPDTYIGSIEPDEVTNYIFQNGNPGSGAAADDSTEDRIVHKTYNYVPGLYKCFDEGIVNARDHAIRMIQRCEEDPKAKKVGNINIEVDKETGIITMYNDGDGIDVAKHPEYDLYIPEMIFGHLRTSTNYKKDEKKIVGGKNGFGFKLVLIYSKWGTIETVDHRRKLKYKQRFSDNLSVIHKPTITRCTTKPYTRVSWLPDYERFGMPDGLTDDMYSLFQKRTYDVAAVTEKTVKVRFNGDLVPVKSFEQYVNMYIGNKRATKRIYEAANPRWEYAVCLSPNDEFTHVSFVNGIYTSKGGKHVDYILNQITRKLIDFIERKKKVKVKSSTIKEQLMLFVNCVVENPSFDSQTKDTMNTAISKFGSTCRVSEKFVEKVAKLGVMEHAISINQVRESKDAKKTDGKKTRSVRGIPKLIDANYAGTAKSSQCTLILCEGDSAKAGIVSGLSREDRNYVGVYPLKGKLMNVRDISVKKLSANKEINELKKILGLESSKKYVSREVVNASLRYGKVLCMTDQDVDGTHIKGLCINLLDSLWGELIQIDSFIGFMNTPILKAKRGSTELSFYNDKEYEDWKSEIGEETAKKWSIKYYKGLGTSTSKEFKEYFAKKKIVDFKFEDDTCTESLDMVFNKGRSDDRKKWLNHYDKTAFLDTSKPSISYSDFVHKELIHFSKYDNERSIPSMVDGLKTSLRKIMYCAFKRNLTKEIKVAQFGGYVSEHSGYHHGEASLMQAIVGLAQEFVGSNNINLLLPNGQFGTRLQGGNDSASERYIFTMLNPISKFIYRPEDAAVLNYLDDDGTPVEPEFYMPVIPMILVNGSTGIGTGFSTDIMSYGPRDIIEYIRKELNGETNTTPLTPYYEGFKGSIHRVEDEKFMFKGVYDVIGTDKIRITELPVGTWTENYKMFLEKQMDPVDKKGKKKKKTLVKSYSDMSTDTNVEFIVQFQKGELAKMIAQAGDYECMNKLEKLMNLTTTKKTTNMHVFDEEQRLIKFDTPESMIDHYIPLRLEYYTLRKESLIRKLEREVCILSNKARFIQEQCDDVLDLRRKRRVEVIEMLNEHEFDVIDYDEEFKYLRNMPIDSVIEENVEKLLKERDAKMTELEILRETTTQTMWMTELDELDAEYVKYLKHRAARQSGTEVKKRVKKKGRRVVKKKIKVTLR